MSKKTETNPLAELTGGMAQLALAEQAMGLKLLLAEMQALTSLIPGAIFAGQQGSPESARDDEQIESDFDNMPV